MQQLNAFVDTAHVMCGAESMKRLRVHPSARLSA